MDEGQRQEEEGGGEALRGAPPEDECQDLEEIRESGFTMYESLEQQQFNATAPAYMKALFHRKDALRAPESENEGGAATSQSKEDKGQEEEEGGEVVADA